MYGKAGVALLALGLPLVLSAPTASAASSAACDQHPVATVTGRTSTSISGVAPGGRFLAGSSATDDGIYHAVRWDNGVPTELPITADRSWANDVNDDGQLVIGTSTGDATANWRYRDEQMEELPTPAGYASATGKAINSRGDILGSVTDADGWNARGVVWNSANQPRVLPIPAGFNEVWVSDIDDDGTVVGTVLDEDIPNAETRNERAAYWFTDGTVQLLPASSATAWSSATAIRGGVAAGQDGDNTVIWQVGTGGTGTPIAGHDDARAINSRGTVALYGNSLPHVYQPGRGDRKLALQDPGGASGGGVGGLTDTDQVYGTDNLSYTPVRWDCS